MSDSSEGIFQAREDKEIAGREIWRIWGVFKKLDFTFPEKIHGQSCGMAGHIVVMQSEWAWSPVRMVWPPPKVRSLLPDSFFEHFESFTISL